MDAVAGHVQRLLGGDAPVVGLQAQLVVAQGGLVEDRQPLHRVCGQGLPREREQQTSGLQLPGRNLPECDHGGGLTKNRTAALKRYLQVDDGIGPTSLH